MAWQLAFAAISAAGQIMAGRAAQRSAALNAYNMRTEGIMNEAMARQQANARLEEYDMATSANLAFFASQGRDIGSDQSVKAFLEKQKQLVGKDVGRMDDQSYMELLKSRSAAGAEKTRGRVARTASLFSAIGTIGEGIQRYQQTKT